MLPTPAIGGEDGLPPLGTSGLAQDKSRNRLEPEY